MLFLDEAKNMLRTALLVSVTWLAIGLLEPLSAGLFYLKNFNNINESMMLFSQMISERLVLGFICSIFCICSYTYTFAFIRLNRNLAYAVLVSMSLYHFAVIITALPSSVARMQTYKASLTLSAILQSVIIIKGMVKQYKSRMFNANSVLFLSFAVSLAAFLFIQTTEMSKYMLLSHSVSNLTHNLVRTFIISAGAWGVTYFVLSQEAGSRFTSNNLFKYIHVFSILSYYFTKSFHYINGLSIIAVSVYSVSTLYFVAFTIRKGKNTFLVLSALAALLDPMYDFIKLHFIASEPAYKICLSDLFLPLFSAFSFIYWAIPKLWNRDRMFSQKLTKQHLNLSYLLLLLSAFNSIVISIVAKGVALDRLALSLYAAEYLLFFAGACTMLYNIWLTITSDPDIIKEGLGRRIKEKAV